MTDDRYFPLSKEVPRRCRGGPQLGHAEAGGVDASGVTAAAMKKRGGLAEWQDQHSPRGGPPDVGQSAPAPAYHPVAAPGVDRAAPPGSAGAHYASLRPPESNGENPGVVPPQPTDASFSVAVPPLPIHLPAFASLEEHAARAGSPLQRAGSPAYSESRMEAAAALVEELSNLKGTLGSVPSLERGKREGVLTREVLDAGQLRTARSTLLSGHNENASRPMRWVTSPHSATPTTRLQTLEGSPNGSNSMLSGEVSGLQTPRSVRETGTVEEEALREQLQATSRRMEELESQVEQGSRALDVANVKLAEQLLLCSTLSAKLLWPDDGAGTAIVELEESTACTVDPFADEAGPWTKNVLREFLPDDPIESLSASDSEDGQSNVPLSSVSPQPGARFEPALHTPELTPEVTTGTRKAEHVRSLRLPGIYEGMTEFIFRQHQKNFKHQIVSFWRSKARERRWSLNLAQDKIDGVNRSLQQAVIQEWSTTCKRWLWLRRAWAKLEYRSERYYLRKFVGLWCEQHQQQLVHECDWDCGFTGSMDEVAVHEKACEAMALATAWKLGTELSLRPCAKSSTELQKDIRDRLLRWIPASTDEDEHVNASRPTETLRRWAAICITFGHCERLPDKSDGSFHRRWLPKDSPQQSTAESAQPERSGSAASDQSIERRTLEASLDWFGLSSRCVHSCVLDFADA